MDIIIDVFSHDSKEIDSEVNSCLDSNSLKTCKYCGKQFVATGRNAWRANKCKRSHYSFCSICGQEFSQDSAISIGTKLSEVCSNPECKNKLSGLRAKKAIQRKYGVDNPFQAECVKEKSRQTSLLRYGTEYPMQSDEVRQHLRESLTSISDERRAEILAQRKQTCIDKYGVDNPLKSEEIRDRSKQTCLQRYGVEYASQSETFRSAVSATWANKTKEELAEIDAKRVKTNRQRYGVDYAAQNPEILAKLIHSLVDKSDEEKAAIRAKMQQTCLDRYGVTAPAKSEEFQAKMRKTTFERFGVEYIFQLPEFREYLRQWTLENYGVENPLQSKELREKGKQTSLQRYGTEYPMQSEEMRKRVSRTRIQNYAQTIEDPVFRQNYLDFMEDPLKYVTEHFDHTPTYNEIEHSIGDRCSCTIYDKVPTKLGIVDQSVSSMEREVENLLKSIDPNIVICKHDHTIIKPMELDIYLPEYHIAIECNPTYTHNSSIPSYSNTDPMSQYYHKQKTDLCEQQCVFLFHIFGYEWNHRRSVIESMIRNLLHQNTVRYFARKLDVIELSSIEAKSFLDANHRQKGVSCSVRLGLKTTDGELVSCMTFSKVRSTIGSSTRDNCDWELVRFCNKVNTSVVGGASRLFKYFLSSHQNESIVSFSDRAHTRGNIYSQLGFKEVSASSPGYVWVNTRDDSFYNRVTCQKQNLRNLFHDDSIDIDNQTEKQIMVSHGFVQVFDSGAVRWEYRC